MLAPTRLAPAPGRRLTRRHGLAALGAAVALAGAVFVLTAGDGDGSPPLVSVPKVVGTPVGTAKSALLEGGFDVRVGAKRHSGRPAGTVAGVRPAGASAERGALITLIPSSGPAPVVVPAVTGFSQEAATAELERRGLVVQPTTAYSAAPAGSAIGTAPAAGDSVAPHSPISLIISAGPQPVAPAEPAPPGWSKDEHKDKPGKGHKKPKQED
jgi:eukaryotic-like serine/threonine-protein kinase